MVENRQLDPEILGILKEIAAQPESVLLTVPRKPLRMPVEPISATAAFLSRAERHLLDVYRDELGEVLLEAARTRMAERPLVERRVHLGSGMPERVFDAHAHGLMRNEATQQQVSSKDAWSALSSHLEDVYVSPTHLARLSNAVAPTERSSISLAVYQIGEGDYVGAEEPLDRAARAASTSVLRANAMANLGCISFRRGRFQEAFMAYREATRQDPGPSWHAVYSLNSSLLMGDRQGATEALASADEQDTEVLSECFDVLRASTTSSSSTRVSTALWSDLRDTAPRRIRSIFDVLFQT